jgi:hypothetical protein
MAEASGGAHDGTRIEGGFQELEVVAYIECFKVVGVAYFGVGHRATSRRASDFIRSFNDTRLTLADASVYDSRSGELLESSPFVVLNLDKVDFLYARDEVRGDGEAAVAAPPAGGPAGPA